MHGMEQSSINFPVNDSLSSNDTDDSSILTPLSPTTNVINEDTFLAQHGYIKHTHLKNTLQGELFAAKVVNFSNCQHKNEYVAIKKTSKKLYQKREAIDQTGFNFIVDEHIIKEALMLRHLTINNQPIGNTIVKYINFLESNTHFYLVMEYIDSNITLKDYVIKSHKYIKNGQLKLSEYNQTIKYLLWQLITTLHWIHNDMHCSHLDLTPENIMLENVEFISNADGSVSINPQIKLKLIDFGVSDIFGYDKEFKCNKQHISIENEQYLSPNIYKQNYYNASKCDMWSYGMIIYFCFVGSYPYKKIQLNDFNEPLFGTDYWLIYKNKLQSILINNNSLKFVSKNILLLLNCLLNFDEVNRYNSLNVLQHPWFRSYYKRYSAKIKRKSNLQRQQFLHQTKFP